MREREYEKEISWNRKKKKKSEQARPEISLLRARSASTGSTTAAGYAR